uniref:CHM Rab escort protein n=1 Tax=Seriola lalandi dorsalis TaxID=1841481 RepID=A0A3B4X242_SERLL
MAAEDLPSEFDVVILGTGLAESVVAAACSRVGQRVLHLDRKSYYAANWASFTFNGLLTWIQQHHEESQPEEVQDWSSLLREGEELIYLSTSDSASISNLQLCMIANQNRCFVQSQASHLEGEEPKADKPCPSTAQSQSEATRKKISYAQLVKEGRRFNIDLVSKLMYSRGSLVDLLIKSNVSRYAEFKNVTRILTYRHGNVEQVCTNCLFTCLSLCVRCPSVKLMCYLSVSQVPLTYNGRPYLEYLRDQQLGDNLQHFLLHSIAMVTEDTPTEVGLTSTRHFLRCLGRYGNTPFLFPVYGLGEIPQCFCRMCAVFGGIYCLRHSVHCLLVDKDTNRYQYYSLQYSQYYSLHYSEYSSLQYSENYSLQYSENYSLQYSQYYSLFSHLDLGSSASLPCRSSSVSSDGGQTFSGLSRDAQLGLGQGSGWASQEWSQSCSDAPPLSGSPSCVFWQTLCGFHIH